MDFDPSLLPIQPSDEVLNVSYGIRSFDLDSYKAKETVTIVVDTPYNVRDVSSDDIINIDIDNTYLLTYTHTHTYLGSYPRLLDLSIH